MTSFSAPSTSAILPATTSATVDPAAALSLGSGKVNLSANALTSFKTVADSSNSTNAKASGTGVGAGIAVEVIGNDVIASLPDGLTITYLKNSLGGVSVSANHKGTEIVTAKAGYTSTVLQEDNAVKVRIVPSATILIVR